MRGPAFEQTLTPYTPGCFVPSLVEIGVVVFEKKIFKNFNIILHFHYYLPFGKERGPAFEQTWIPSTKGCFVPSLVEIGLVVLEKKLKMWKVYRRTDRLTTDNRRSEKLTRAFSSGELKRYIHTSHWVGLADVEGPCIASDVINWSASHHYGTILIFRGIRTRSFIPRSTK